MALTSPCPTPHGSCPWGNRSSLAPRKSLQAPEAAVAVDTVDGHGLGSRARKGQIRAIGAGAPAAGDLAASALPPPHHSGPLERASLPGSPASLASAHPHEPLPIPPSLVSVCNKGSAKAVAEVLCPNWVLAPDCVLEGFIQQSEPPLP